MNKEIEEALRHFQEAVDSKKGPIMFDYTIAIKDVELLLSYIEQLENNRDKAIEYIETHTENIDRGTYYEDYVETYDLLNILKGDSDDE